MLPAALIKTAIAVTSGNFCCGRDVNGSTRQVNQADIFGMFRMSHQDSRRVLKKRICFWFNSIRSFVNYYEWKQTNLVEQSFVGESHLVQVVDNHRVRVDKRQAVDKEIHREVRIEIPSVEVVAWTVADSSAINKQEIRLLIKMKQLLKREQSIDTTQCSKCAPLSSWLPESQSNQT